MNRQLRKLARGLLREQFIQHSTERENIAPHIHALVVAAALLRTHIDERAKNFTRLGCRALHARMRSALDQSREPEVDDLQLRRRRHQDVGGLQVAMQHALRVRRSNRHTCISKQSNTAAKRQLARVLGETSRTRHKLRCNPRRCSRRICSRCIDRSNMRMIHNRKMLGFKFESSTKPLRRKIRAKNLQRH